MTEPTTALATTCVRFQTIDSVPLNFCAIQYRRGTDGCKDCSRGKDAARDTREEIQNNSDRPDGRRFTVEERQEREAGTMADKKKCSKGCGKGAVKDGLCTKHYKEKHGAAPFPSGQASAGNRKSTDKPERKAQGGGPHDLRRERSIRVAA